MLYPKVKRKKQKIKISLLDTIISIKSSIYIIINVLKSREYFVLFMKKNFHF